MSYCDSKDADLDTENLQFEEDQPLKKSRVTKSVLADGWPAYLKRTLFAIFLTSKLNLLLPCIPLAIISNWYTEDGTGGVGSEGWTFTFALLGIAPLAERLGFITEELAGYTNQTLGGLLNASFGNLTEMIVSIFALKGGLLRVVQLSLLGSILSNLLLVLGCAFLFGGLKYKEQTFNSQGINANTGLLCLAVMGMSLPAILRSTHSEMHGTGSEVALSRISSVFLLCIYFAYLYFQLITHRELFEDDEDDEEKPEREDGEEDEEDEEESAGLGMWGCVVWLGILTIFISLLSEYLVDTIEGAAAKWDMSVAFVSVIILPIVGNAAEHASAIIFAVKNKMDISLGVAIGSSTQIALLVFPFCVLLGWVMDQPMDLNLEVFETSALCTTVIIVGFMVSDGKSNWLMGLTLVLAYLILACAFLFHRDVDLKLQWPGMNA